MTTTDAIGRMWPSGDRFGVTFERTYDAAITAVWAAITEPAALAGWFAPVGGSLTPGGRYAIDFGEESQAGIVQSCDPSTGFAVSWDHPDASPSVVTVRLLETGEGTTRLTLEHDALPGSGAAGYSAGWHAYLDRLTASLTDANMPDWLTRWEDVLGDYKRQLAVIPMSV